MTEENSKKIKRTFVKDEAYNVLHDQIIEGKLKPYTQLKISELSKELGISRTPIREAILKLENEDLIISKANQWTMVAPIKVHRLKDIYPLVYELESFALRENFSKIDDKFIDELERINEKINIEHMNKNIMKVIELDDDFHNLIISLSGNKEIKPIIERLKKRIKRFEICFYQVKDSHKAPSTYSEHKELIKNLRNRDLEASLAALKKNWITTISDESIEKISQLINMEN
ncbi:GntR family transcriptional regulator [uncultured Anaerococcus sp.]|uniref:GntR family transcriptional regulator n=1 Tax=uncultured Anaerococcus sp. TaxID=293428 RepID=UPI0025E9735E|nr:GntR family transcriptional regulator [uncultured Anaerococcus sp.]